MWRELLTAYVDAPPVSASQQEDDAYDLIDEVPASEAGDFYKVLATLEIDYSKECDLIDATRTLELHPSPEDAVEIFDLLASLDDRIRMAKVVGTWWDGSPELGPLIRQRVDALPDTHRAKAMVASRLEPL